MSELNVAVEAVEVATPAVAKAGIVRKATGAVKRIPKKYAIGAAIAVGITAAGIFAYKKYFKAAAEEVEVETEEESSHEK